MNKTLPTAALAAAALCVLPGGAGAAYNTLDGAAPLVIGHRGASGYRPEHTLESYRLAIELGADFIEPDVVMTKDNVLIARHEPMLGGTTDVASRPEFAARRTTKVVDGVSETNWFASDFTLAEIKTLRAVQPRASRDPQYNGLYQIPTLDEVISLAQAESARRGRTVGIYPELKHSTFHAGLYGDKVFENTLVNTLHAAYGNTRNAPVFVQSFEIGNLQYLNQQTDIRLVQLVDANDVNADGSLDLTAPYGQPYDVAAAGGRLTFADMLTNVGLGFVKTYADGIGPWKPYLVKTEDDGIDRNGDGVVDIKDRRVDGSTGIIEAAHANGLLVHVYTFRNDASGYGFTDPIDEMAYYMNVGVDGVFTDFPDTGVLAVSSVPEPGSYALMLGGLSLLGWLSRRRKNG
jgi:glycerophosphoryl diester phosphodiesterase